MKLYVFSFRRRLFDPIDDRKTHLGLIPRMGGMAFLPTQGAIFFLVIIILRSLNIINVDYVVLVRFLMLFMGLGLLFVTGIVDDLMSIYYKWKFVAQTVAAMLIPVSGLWIVHLDGLFGIVLIPAWIGIPLTILIIVFIINAFNLIDGIDGLCSGLTILACTVLGTLSFRHESWLPVIFSFITVGTLAPFFYYNVFGKSKRRRRIFMGDTGSTTLGLTVSFLVLSYAVGDPAELHPGGNLLVAFSVVLVPALDVLRVILLRLIKRKPLFKPDNTHIHHYLLRLGFSKYAVLLIILMLASGFIVFNMLFVKFVNNNQTMICLLDIALWFTIIWIISLFKPRQAKVGQSKTVIHEIGLQECVQQSADMQADIIQNIELQDNELQEIENRELAGVELIEQTK
jgi:UDP-N-acetylmuramyl pentapeptide phosphotransferase/UDP-N-acetylglucosamine-1-phosphate transferase